jgi:hypothetical protein
VSSNENEINVVVAKDEGGNEIFKKYITSWDGLESSSMASVLEWFIRRYCM